MKKINNKYKLRFTIPLLLLVTVGFWACKKSFLETTPYGRYGDAQLYNAKGIDALLVGAYGMLDGESQFKYGENWATPSTNWVYGDIASDDAYKGTDANDQPNMTAVEIYNWLPSNNYFYARWISIYDGIARANDVIKVLALTKEANPAEVSVEFEKNVTAEARFIRGWQHFEAKRMWGNIPYVDETATENPGNGAADVWAKIEADFQAAYDNLPGTQSQLGRVNKWAAGAYLAKAKLYQGDYSGALAIFNIVKAQGVTPKGDSYKLLDAYWQNFDPRYENGPESVFAIQFAAQGSQEGDGSRGYGLAFPYGGDFGCCGFLQPSQNLVNAYKTDANGLPLLNTFNDVDVKSDEGVKSADPYTIGTENMDPRVDWSVGRRSVPFWDWGPHPGQNWIRDQGYAGPYSPKKHIYSSADENGFNGTGWNNVTAKNYGAMRYADMLLMMAECEVEVGSLDVARGYVNEVRLRAGKEESKVVGSPAKYLIKTYDAAWTDKAVARQAVRFERRLELAMEGHRFFDLVRYDQNPATPTEAETTLNAFITKEKEKRTYLKAANTFAAKNKVYPIPERAIVLSNGKITQNTGY
ncbi:RagB/SusD family nutrient uptake outer membrane protein [Flavihumibacter fluvii]|uniref:RagB/SusD family nutrient uptake outer membrane protein n=1 Tax=Flavihumibacter fluvii TaxID=2838157 RepID=UPI001BDE0354|nr:RagB/SusD family nutrient uptake outer membrane protein [Flavihumibacter fluvii]ULQ53739.1 RagB/SusD family nutrient uptake outer membrane protein [Flavihumibacter fluvii]